MNILIINHYAGGPDFGSELRPFLLARQWAGEGDRVTIVAADYSHKRRQNPMIDRDLEEKNIGGVTYAFVATPPYENGVGGQGKNISIFARKLFGLAGRLAEQYAPDMVVASSTHPYDIFAARRIARRRNCPIIFELHQNWPDIQEELYGRELGSRLARHVMKTALRRSDRVVSLLPRGADYLSSLRVDKEKEKCVYIPEIPFFPTEEGELAQRRSDYLARLRRGYDFLVMYQGYVSDERGLGQLVEAAKLLEGHNVAVIIIGNGGYKINLKRRMRELMAANVYLMDKAAEGEKQGLFALADCLFFADEREAAVKYGVSSSKLMEYMAAGKPVVTALKTDESPVVLAGCGLNTKEGSAQALADTILELVNMSGEHRRAMGERGRAFLREHHDAQMLARRFYQVFLEVAEKK